MIALVSLVPLYIFIAAGIDMRAAHVPSLPLDAMVPLEPAWALLYGALYFFLIALPVFLLREPTHLRRTVYAFLMIWMTAYVCFLLYPTAAPRPAAIPSAGFAAWGLSLLYSADPPVNCFPSLHVAHSVLAALTCARVHRRVGIFALACAGLVALSTLFTKQHYVLDVAAGIALATVAHALFLRTVPEAPLASLERRLAPLFAAGTLAVAGLGIVTFWVVYRLSVAR